MIGSPFGTGRSENCRLSSLQGAKVRAVGIVTV